jgi:hypothetical protein
MPEHPFDTIINISLGFTLSRALQVIAELGVADALGDTPQSADELARSTGTHSEALNRCLRLLSAHGVFRKEGAAYVHTAASQLLRTGHPMSMRPWCRMQGFIPLWHIWEQMDYTVKTGRSAEKGLPGGSFWDYLNGHREHGRIFNDAMTGKTNGQAAGLLAAYDFSKFRSIADIGGGNGQLLRALLAANPSLEGVLFDLPNVIAQAQPAGRLKLHGGSFFEGGLPVCDAYILMQILHDWSDEESGEILTSVRRAAPSNAKLLLVEFLVPQDNTPSWSLLLDMIMMVELTGRERTEAEFREMLARTGFRLDRVIDAGFNTFLLEASVA